MNKKEPETGRVLLEKEALKKYLADLVPKLNARLFEEQKTGIEGNIARVLWVESITLTAYDIENDTQKGR